MRTTLLFVIVASVLQGCGTMTYTPTEWTIKDGVISHLDVAGTVSIENAQPSVEPAIVYSYGGTKLQTNYKAVTGLLAAQAQKELQKAGSPARSGAPKKIELKVTKLESHYIAFYFKSVMDFEAKLGDGEVIVMQAGHGSADVHQDLNGCIAQGVLDLLRNDKVRAYLAK